MPYSRSVQSSARLIYVIGPSGAGKDSLINYCRHRLAGHSTVLFAHRYITRDAHAGSENHIAVSSEEFAAREAASLFALCWQSHGLHYGIGMEIEQWMAKGITVVVNGSRQYLDEARRRYPDLVPVWIAVSPEVLRERLQARAREGAPEIEARLARAALAAPAADGGIVITNDGALAQAGEALLAVITEGMDERVTACA
ncbi:phosphonate metabolism protein/1,5-bisphosphokinase (PRPP-forming) PhnN [Lacisediminimonas sp.]|uniref:phosphonate metabolism protein/1,5-bisphosphokinase (PRPP-forming) PhnN n=1 Tax=Lacisediminimonas sp. TaxID=3060582 RepID=UPI00271C5293|nr:phosphonate metabolism protein/1,5-bisphosphokinase (PRPP-forming) PhnN [Lacisediminimonas sp.]MDO8298768.1 phosphonate metabolism protein/1,5-bisphosphokinase (PRPP-forming) PhnN [Lacisediminimonas sp.]